MAIQGPAPAGRDQTSVSRTAGARRRDWRIDARTRRAGLRGVAQARTALAATRRHPTDGHSDAA